jgi:hypothetical protein
MQLAFEADELLQELVSKRRIRFLHVRRPSVQQAIRERGEYWRISPRPQSQAEIAEAIRNARIGIDGNPIYYYNAVTGTRYLTLESFLSLDGLPDDELRAHMVEIQTYAAKLNRRKYREVNFFAVDSSFGSDVFQSYDFQHAEGRQLRAWHADIAYRFAVAVAPDMRQDDMTNLVWRNALFTCLMEERQDTVLNELVPCCTPEFFRQINWLPGGRIENGELMFDSIFSEYDANPDDDELAALCDQKVKGCICNYVRDFGALQYVNIGRLTPSIRRRERTGGHRAYIAEVRHRSSPKSEVRILRVQRWGIREHLDAGRDLLWSIMQAEEYTEYILDRRLGCWELRMPLPERISPKRVREIYYGKSADNNGVTRIWTTYYERDFIEGVATDKIRPECFAHPDFALKFARLLGRAAAPNLVVGRTTLNGKDVIFDTGDEMLITNEDGLPVDIVVADHAGTFNEFKRPLTDFAEAYAKPAACRLTLVPDPDAFADAYVSSLGARLREMQNHYRRNQREFDTLFKHSKQGEGTFSWRWARVLARMNDTDVGSLEQKLLAACRQQETGMEVPDVDDAAVPQQPVALEAC